MRGPTVFLACALSSSLLAVAAPLEVRQDSNDSSCTAETLSPDTWNNLDIDTFMNDWAAQNVTPAASNNIQALASSFGAPNFFWSARSPWLPLNYANKH